MTVLNQVVGLLAGGWHTTQFTFKADSLGADTFRVIDFSVEEGLSAPFTVKLRLASDWDNLTAKDVVDQYGVLTLYRNELPERYFHGVVFSFIKGNSGRHHTFYEMTLVPGFSRLSLRSNSRIFQNKTVIEIAEELLSEMSINDYALAIRHSHEVREFCVQYSESDLDFMERLFAEEGIFYYFEHEQAKHTVVFADDNSVTQEFPFNCLYNNLEGGLAESSCIRSLTNRAMMAPTDAVLKDYSFKQPSHSFLSQASGDDTDYQKNYEHYMYPGRFKDDTVGKAFSKNRIDYLRRDAKTIKGKGDIAQMISGYVVKIDDNPDISANDKWLVTHVRHEGTQPQSVDNEGLEGQTHYHNTFYALPYSQQWKPQPEVKPRIYGPQVAVVVGPPDEEIYIDEFGRVKVQFPWDRYGKSNENSSCWIRVAQVGAGAGYGNIVIPRIGHEVIVSFLEGDPDQPVVTGATFHATNRASINLPADKTMMAFRGKTHDGKGTGEGYNEMTFENDDGRQMFAMHAQKDMNTKVRNNRSTDVAVDHTETIGANQSISIGGNQENAIKGSQNTIVTNTRSITVETGDESKTIAAGSLTEDITGTRTTKSNGVLVDTIEKPGPQTYQASDSITLKVGASNIELMPDAIKISVGSSSITITNDAINNMASLINSN